VRRLAVLPVAAAIAAASLAACGSSSTTSSSSTTAGGGSSTTAAGGTGGSVTIQTGNPTKPITLSEDGSSLLSPYLQELVAPLHAAYPNVTFSPAAGGSGKGISDALSGVSVLGGTDAYLSPGQASANPDVQNIPIVVSAQAVNYNLPGVTQPLKLSGDVIAQMYQGKITTWNDPAIAKLNPGVTLPATTVVPVHRSDSSGDTFIFSSFLSATNTTWQSSPGAGTSIAWPQVSGELTANGNPGMVQSCSSAPGCIAYVGVSSESAARTANLGEAELQNKAGQFTTPTTDAINSAVTASLPNVMPNLVANLIYAGGAGSYPIVNFEYLVVKNTQPDADTALAVRDFFAFALDPTEGATPTNLAKEGFVALPNSVLPKVKAAVAKITS
jgi:phosphate transport system substrate-binding protein